MRFYNVATPLYLETNPSSSSLGAGLIEVREGMNGGPDKRSDNVILHPNALPAGAYLAWSGTTAALNVRLLESFTGQKCFTTPVVQGRYVLSLTTCH